MKPGQFEVFAVFFLIVLSGCSGGTNTNLEQAEEMQLRSTLLTGESSEVFTEFWECESNTDPNGLLLSFWTEPASDIYGTLSGASVEKTADSAPYAIEWKPLNAASIELTTTNLAQQSPDETYQIQNIVAVSGDDQFTGSDSRGKELTCTRHNGDVEAYCQFWGQFVDACVSDEMRYDG